jgi:hypothetical protein
VFKKLDFNAASDVLSLPKPPVSFAVDGSSSSGEWGKSLLCDNFYSYEQKGKYFSSILLKNQPRIRLMSDSSNLYLTAQVQKGDKLELLVATEKSDAPKKIVLDPAETNADGAAGLICKTGTTKDSLEAKIPFSVIGIPTNDSFLLNMIISKGKTVSYWRGNAFSYQNPVIFAELKKSK